MADVWLVEPVEPGLFRDRLAASMPPGMAVKFVAQVALSAPSLQQLMAESAYQVRFLDPVDEAELRERIEAMLAATTFPLERRRSKDSRPKAFDLRPLILDMRLMGDEGDGPQLSMRLVQTATQTGRPDDVLAALGLDPLAAKVHRTDLKLAESSG
jgi:radical SAM-linked protein